MLDHVGGLIVGHHVESVALLRWGALGDAELLEIMAGKFDVLVTVDQSMPSQQFGRWHLIRCSDKLL